MLDLCKDVLLQPRDPSVRTQDLGAAPDGPALPHPVPKMRAHRIFISEIQNKTK